jgi:hypothetical protein
MEQGALFESTFGPLTGYYHSSGTSNGKHQESTDDYKWLHGTGYQAQRAQVVVKSYYNKADPSVSSPDGGVCGYLMNPSVLTGYLNLLKIADGTSNTMMLAEGYAKCAYRYINKSGPPNTTDIDETYNYLRVWNKDPYYGSYTYDETSSYTSNPYYDYLRYTSSENIAPTFYSGAYDYTVKPAKPLTFQERPKVADCNANTAQSTTSGALVVALCDGSVRLISPGISLATWRAAYTPSGGDQLGSDW